PNSSDPQVSAAKVWLHYTGQTNTLNGSYNVSSVVRQSTGIYVVNFALPFSSSNYAAITSTTAGHANFTSNTPSSITIQNYDPFGNLVDSEVFLTAFGAQ